VREEPTPEEHWAAVASELGETIRGYALARTLTSDEINKKVFFAPQPTWCLLFLTNEALYLERGSTSNWFQRLIGPRRTDEEPSRERIPLRSISGVTVPPAKTGLYRLLSSPEVLVRISHAGGPGDLLVYLDRRGPNDRKLIGLLEELNTSG
jgi:hypothetical protein